MLLYFIRPTGNSTYKIFDLLEIKLLTRLRLGHLSRCKFRHNFADSLNLLCFCSLKTETTLHFFRCYQIYTTLLRAFMPALKNFNDIIMSFSEIDLLHVKINGNKNFDSKMNMRIKFIKRL